MEAQFQRNIRWSFVGTVTGAGFQLLQMLVFARVSSPAAMGDYALAAACMAFFLPVAEGGVSQAVVQAKQLSPAHLAGLIYTQVALSSVVYLVLWLLAPLMAQWFGNPETIHLLRWMGVSLLIAPLGAVHGGLLVRGQDFRSVAMIETVAALAGFIKVWLLAACQGAFALALAWVVRALATALGNILASAGSVRIPWSHPAGWWALQSYWRFSAGDLGARWADFLSNYLDKLLVGKWLGNEALGLYQLVFSIVVAPTGKLGYLISRVSFPVFARMQDDLPTVQRFFDHSSRLTLRVLLPVYVLIIWAAPEILGMFFGPEWLPAAPLLMAFGVAGFVRSLGVGFPQMMRGLGRSRLLFYWSVFWTLVINLALFTALFLQPDLVAVGWGRVVVELGVALPGLFWLAGRMGLRFGPVFLYALQMLAVLAILVMLGHLIPGSPRL
jgi:O-antigen/teichoic acid export membrane protein